MTSVRLRIDHIAVDLADERRAAEAESTLRTALALLASRLAAAPLDLGDEAPVRALDRLDLEPVAPDWFAGPAAAERIADELYARIWEGR
jgi:hypothetical protein